MKRCRGARCERDLIMQPFVAYIVHGTSDGQVIDRCLYKRHVTVVDDNNCRENLYSASSDSRSYKTAADR